MAGAESGIEKPWLGSNLHRSGSGSKAEYGSSCMSVISGPIDNAATGLDNPIKGRSLEVNTRSAE
jgi:hypothetical protein